MGGAAPSFLGEFGPCPGVGMRLFRSPVVERAMGAAWRLPALR
jgi:hypothetical protein